MKSRLSEMVVVVLAIVFCFSAFLMLHEFFSKDLSDLSIEILAAVLGTVVTVSCMVLMLRFQARQEKEKEFSTQVFERKLGIYQQLLGTIFKMDDDGVIAKGEIQDVENQVGVAALVAGTDLVCILSSFVCQLKQYGCVYLRSMDSEQKQDFATRIRDKMRENPEEAVDEDDAKLATMSDKEFNEIEDEDLDDLILGEFVELDKLVQSMRNDLGVIEGEDIEGLIEDFVRIRFDAYNLVRRPNVVD